MAECRSRGSGTGCMVRVWGCNGPVVEEDLGLSAATRRQIQLGLRSAGFDPGGADGLFGPRTRAAIRNWQSSRGARSTGYLDGPQVEALRNRGAPQSPASGRGRGAGCRRGGSCVLAVGPEQHEPRRTSRRICAGSRTGCSVSWRRIGWGRYVARPVPRRRLPCRAPAESARRTLGSPVSGAPARTTGKCGWRRCALAVGRSVSPCAVFRPAQTCAGQPSGAACWQELSAAAQMLRLESEPPAGLDLSGRKPKSRMAELPDQTPERLTDAPQ